MLIWLLCASVVTFATGFYLSRAGVEKSEIYKAVVACVLFAVVGGFGIEFIQYQPAVQEITQDDRLALRKLSEEPIVPAVNRTAIIAPAASKANVLEPELAWQSIAEREFELQNLEQFTHSRNAPFVNYRAHFLNKTKKIIVGIELEVVSRNCSNAGEDKKNCPIESGPILDKRTNIVVPPNGRIPVGTYAPINGDPGNYVMDVKVTRVAYFAGPWPKNIPLAAASDIRLPARGNSTLDPAPTCGTGQKLNTSPLPSAGIADAGFVSKGSAHRC